MVSVRALRAEKALMLSIEKRLVLVQDPDERIRLMIQKRDVRARLDVLNAEANAERQSPEQVEHSGPGIGEMRAERAAKIRADVEWRRPAPVRLPGDASPYLG